MDKSEVVLIKLNGKNYMTQSFHLKNFVEGQGLLGHLDGIEQQPIVDKGKDKTMGDKDNDSTSTVSKIVDATAVLE